MMKAITPKEKKTNRNTQALSCPQSSRAIRQQGSRHLSSTPSVSMNVTNDCTTDTSSGGELWQPIVEVIVEGHCKILILLQCGTVNEIWLTTSQGGKINIKKNNINICFCPSFLSLLKTVC
eukprot:Selendium_serpulae@DN6433_c0_g1_i14.p1